MGKELFSRSPKGLALTADGLLLMPYAREILTLNDQAGQRLNGKQMEGRVRLGVVEDFAATRLIDILAAFRDQNPKVHMDIIVEPNKRLAAMFENDKLDIVVCDTTSINRKPVLIWGEHMLWAVRADLTDHGSAAADHHVRGHLPLVGTLHRRALQPNPAMEDRLRSVDAGGHGGRRSRRHRHRPDARGDDPGWLPGAGSASDLPAPVRIDIGLYARAGAPEEARYLADFIGRHTDLVEPGGRV